LKFFEIQFNSVYEARLHALMLYMATYNWTFNRKSKCFVKIYPASNPYGPGPGASKGATTGEDDADGGN